MCVSLPKDLSEIEYSIETFKVLCLGTLKITIWSILNIID